jgi:hypothetical protein
VGLLKTWDWARGQQPRLRPVLAGILVVLVLGSLALNLPGRLNEAHGFYGISRSQLEPIQEAELQDALVIVYADRWLEYGALLSSMSPTLDDVVVYARGINPELDATVIEDYPGRTVYYLANGLLSPTPPSP